MAKNAIPKSKAKTAYGLLSEIRKLILEEPKRYYQGSWRASDWLAPEQLPACGTVCCVAGWVDTLKSPKPAGDKDWDVIEDRPLAAARAIRILGLSENQSWTLFNGHAAGDYSNSDPAAHAKRGAAHIARFQKKYAAQLKAKRV